MSGGVEVVVFPRIAGVRWSDTVGSTLTGMAAGVAIVLDIVLGPAKIVPVVLPASAVGVVIAGAWSSIYGAVAFGGPCRLGSCMYLRQWGARRPRTSWSECGRAH